MRASTMSSFLLERTFLFLSYQLAREMKLTISANHAEFLRIFLGPRCSRPILSRVVDFAKIRASHSSFKVANSIQESPQEVAGSTQQLPMTARPRVWTGWQQQADFSRARINSDS